MAGVKWYGQGVFHRETVIGDKICARYLTPVVPDALIYNRLFAWKASFAVVPDNLADCFVSNEFPKFIPDASKVLPEYLHLWCTSELTIKAVNAASTGSAAVSRNRFRENYLLESEIPLPPLVVQRKIVAKWEAAKSFAVETAAKIERLEHDIETRFLANLGLKPPEKITLTAIQTRFLGRGTPVGMTQNPVRSLTFAASLDSDSRLETRHSKLIWPKNSCGNWPPRIR